MARASLHGRARTFGWQLYDAKGQPKARRGLRAARAAAQRVWFCPTDISPLSVIASMAWTRSHILTTEELWKRIVLCFGASVGLLLPKSTNNGATWSSPIRITRTGEEIRRANIAVSGSTVHVFGGQSGAGGYGTGIFYFRSTNGGRELGGGSEVVRQADGSARMAVDGPRCMWRSARCSRRTRLAGEAHTCSPRTAASRGAVRFSSGE